MKVRKIGVSRWVLAAAASLLVAGMSTSTFAQDQTRDQLRDHTGDQTPDRTRDRDRLRDPIYGSQLMTSQERTKYQAQMRTLKTEQEREAFRLEHHQQMQERARLQGVTLPETPPNPRPGKGGGPGYGSGAGPGPSANTGTSTGPGPSASTGTSTGPGPSANTGTSTGPGPSAGNKK
ncbi:MAG: hypothetical protein PHQ58_00690 [Rhodoferax sp.]|uniref:hypothetical protein n=1 Tax=Rhodoferax sp. TaxID=50421 RepID=UPI00260CE227|nr:hypothetical protein [Rhodoferax sp.]MDD2878927.1 hypothetical protein [Rhodoferax sp.]